MKKKFLFITIISLFTLVGCGHKPKNNSNSNEGLAILNGKVPTKTMSQPKEETKAQPQAKASSQKSESSLPPLGIKTIVSKETSKPNLETHQITNKHQISKPIQKIEIHKKIEQFNHKKEVSNVIQQENSNISREQELMNKCIKKENQWAKYVCGDVVKREMEGN